MEVHRAAFKHGIAEPDVRHAVVGAIVWFDLEPDADPPKVLAIGPDRAGNLLEVVILELADARWLAITRCAFVAASSLCSRRTDQ